MTSSLRSYTHHTVLFTDKQWWSKYYITPNYSLIRSCLQDVPQWLVMWTRETPSWILVFFIQNMSIVLTVVCPSVLAFGTLKTLILHEICLLTSNWGYSKYVLLFWEYVVFKESEWCRVGIIEHFEKVKMAGKMAAISWFQDGMSYIGIFIKQSL